MKARFRHWFIALVLLACANQIFAQGTAFTYQGQLQNNGSPANGTYNLTFSLFNTNAGAIAIAGPATNNAVAVSNGLFTVLIDFGPGAFTGATNWLEIGVETNGGNAFTTLAPRQQLTPAPYAIMAGAASSLQGTLPAAQLSGAYGGAVSFSNSADNFVGTFSGNGAGLTNVPHAYLNVLTAGVTNDGVTDVTVPLQNLLNAGGAFYFPPGRYYAQELTLTNNTTLLGSGAVLVYATNPQNNKIFVRCLTNNNISISGLGFDGGDYSDITTRTFATYTGTQNFSAPDQYCYWNPTGLRHGLQINIEAGGSISAITISGFSGIGLLPVAVPGVNVSQSPKTFVRGVSCYANFTGLFSSGEIGQSLVVGTNVYLPNWITNYVPGASDPEWMSYSGLNLFSNTVGMCASAGNSTYVNSTIDGNLIGQLDSYGNLDHHGCINSIIYTHNINAALYIAGSAIGEQIINCQFRDNENGAVTLNNTQGITIDFCTFSPLSITNELTYGTGQNFFRNNTYSGTWASRTFSTDGHLIYYGNHSYDTAGNNDGQPLTLLETGNTAGIVFTNAAGAPFQIQVNPATNGFNFLAP